jgi:ribonuclease VapC
MVVDTSAVLAVAFAEPEAASFAELIEAHALRLVSAATWVELSIVIRQRVSTEAEARVTRELLNQGFEIVPVDCEQADLARQAFAIFGKGRHRASLNFGDCFSYALARSRNLPLLYKGNDFALTDVEFPTL